MVQFNDMAQEEAAWGMLEGRSIPAWKFSEEVPAGSGNYIPKSIGFGYTGTLAESPQQRQATDYTTKEPKFYKDRQPIMEIILTLNTNERLDQDDDGTRRWYLSGMARRALQDEMKRLNIKRFGIGTQVSVQVAGFKPNPKGRATMLFNVQLVPTEYVAPQQRAVEQTMHQPYQENGQPQQWHQPQQVQQYQQQVQQYQQPVAPQQYQQPVAPQVAPQQFPQPVAQAAPQGLFQGQPGYHQDRPVYVPPVAPQVAPQQYQQDPAAPQVQQFQQPVAQAPVQAPVQMPVQAPAAAAPQVLNEQIQQVHLLMNSANINRQAAIQAVADGFAPGNDEYRAMLDRSIAPEGMNLPVGETFIA